MFRYADNNQVSKPREDQRRVVTEVRKVTYLNDSSDDRISDPVVSFGYETVKEVAVSPDFCDTIPKVVEEKTIDNRNPNRVVKRDYTEREESNGQ